MPPSGISNSADEPLLVPGWKSGIWIGVVAVVLMVAAVVLIGAFWWFSMQEGDPATYVSEASSAIRQGDLSAALTAGQRVENSPVSSADERALAKLTSSNVQYRTTGNPAYMLDPIRAFKSVIEDEEVSLRVRVAAINSLGSSFCGSGRTPAVFEELYKGDPYSSFLVPGDPEASQFNIYKWSYNMTPTAMAAMQIARLHAGFAHEAHLQHGSIDAVHVEEAKTFLALADDLAHEEGERDPSYESSLRQLQYRYWRTYTVGILAYLEEGTYRDQYRAEFENFLNTFPEESFLRYNYLSYARLIYAYLLVHVEGDEDAARVQLAAIPPFVRSDPYFETDPFVRFIHNEREARAKGLRDPFTVAMLLAYEISPEFSEFAASIP